MKQIDTLYAFVADDTPEQEGIVGARMPNGEWMPLVTSKEQLLPEMRRICELAAAATGKKTRLVKFTQREVVEEL